MNANLFASAEAAAAWQRGAEGRNQTLGDATDQMVRAARLGPGDRVLDVGAGTGDTAIMAAHRVVPDGSVLATDISASMLDTAAEMARLAGLDNIQTLCADMAALDLVPASCDAVMARNSLQFADGIAPVLRAVYAALRPGGRFAALVWDAPSENAYMWLHVAVARRLGLMRVSEDVLMRPFALGDAGACRTHLRGAGFAEVTVTPIAVERRHPSTEAAVARACDGALFRALIAGLRPEEVTSVVNELSREMEQFMTVAGQILAPGSVLLLTAERPM